MTQGESVTFGGVRPVPSLKHRTSTCLIERHTASIHFQMKKHFSGDQIKTSMEDLIIFSHFTPQNFKAQMNSIKFLPIPISIDPIKILYRISLIVAICLSFNSLLQGQPVSQDFSDEGTHTWTCPAGYTANITVKAWAGGGGGGDGNPPNIAKGGGGGGGYAASTFTVNPGTYNIQVGPGGAFGNDGFPSHFQLAPTTFVSASGGGGGSSFDGGDGGVGIVGDVKHTGGAGADASGNNGGGGGGSATETGNGSPGSGTSGGSGEGMGGNGGGNGQAGSHGSAPGGGGGGKGRNGANSGIGGDGFVSVIVNSSSPLPVELVYFKGEATLNTVNLQWETATEIDNSHFDVEWSTDGRVFQKIGQVTGAGTTTVTQHYGHLHKTPVNGNNYYRLKQVDFYGKFEYSKIINIRYRTSEIEYSIYPNPISDFIIIENIEEEELVQIFSANGILVTTFQSQKNSAKYPVGDFPKGIYFVQIRDTVKRIIIQ